MMNLKKLLSMASAVTVLLALSTLSGFAQGRHPGYLRALSDLRAARAHLENADHRAIGEREGRAIREIDAAIDEIKRAAINDGKDLYDHPPIDTRLDRLGRRHRALELLNAAHNDIAREEDNRFAQGLQRRAMEHIDQAHRHVEEAIASGGR
jgi:hypothetical protein